MSAQPDGRVVVCVLRSGGLYDATWVGKLARGFSAHNDYAYRFVCLSDVDVPCERVPLQTDWPGWYAKLELFRPGLFPDNHTVLYLDLDTLVLGSCRHLLDWWGGLCMLSDFYRPQIPASGVMVWNTNHTPPVYDDALAANLSARARQRLDFWLGPRVTCERIQELWPGHVVSYKVHARVRPPEDARLVCGHGRPRFSDPAAGWAHAHWREL